MAISKRLQIRKRTDFISGLVFVGLGLFGVFEALQYDMGIARRMGPGYLPTILSVILIGLGIATAVASLGLRSAGDDLAKEAGRQAIDTGEKTEAWPALRAGFFVVIALISFAATMPYIGLVLAVVLLVVIASFADPKLGWLETGVIAAVMAFLAVAIFRWGIGLPFPIWP